MVKKTVERFFHFFVPAYLDLISICSWLYLSSISSRTGAYPTAGVLERLTVTPLIWGCYVQGLPHNDEIGRLFLSKGNGLTVMKGGGIGKEMASVKSIPDCKLKIGFYVPAVRNASVFYQPINQNLQKSGTQYMLAYEKKNLYNN